MGGERVHRKVVNGPAPDTLRVIYPLPVVTRNLFTNRCLDAANLGRRVCSPNGSLAVPFFQPDDNMKGSRSMSMLARQLSDFRSQVRELWLRWRDEFSSDSGATFTDSGDGANRKVTAASLQSRGGNAVFLAQSPREGRANSAYIELAQMGASTVVSGAITDTGKASV
jgi:hypothetical protein